MKRKLFIAASIAALVVLGGWFADRKLKGHDHPGLFTFMEQWWVNYPASFAVEPITLKITVDQKSLDDLEAVVAEARARGVIMPEGNDYVPAELVFGGSSFKAKIRIKGKMADHVQGSKWSFRVVAKKDKGFLGMQRFSLQHPGTRNYLCDWFYHRLMQGEGVIALRYGFIRLEFNDEDLGIYAYEEHFGPELLANNGRSNGPLFRFDPGLFWEHRLNMLEKVRYNEPFGAYQAAAVDPFGTSELEKDSTQRAFFEEAISRMDAFRRGQLSASQVFDADKLGRRHAILDLVGGHHSMDWSDVKFYFDPVLKRIEPVAYESFSAFPIRTLAGSDRFIGKQDAAMDLHDAYFNDVELFKAYVHHLERVSRPSYLDSAFAALAPALDSASALIYREFPYKELDRSIYYKNQKVIRKLLDVPKGFHAYFNGGTDTVRIAVVPIEGLPIEVHGLLADDGTLIPPTHQVVVPCRSPGRMGEPLEFSVVVKGKWSAAAERTMRIRYSVLGASVQKELDVFPYGYLDGLVLPSITSQGSPDMHSMPFLSINEVARTISFLPGKWVIAQDLFLPEGYTVKAIAPLRLDLQHGARIVSRSAMEWIGMDDASITVVSTDRSGGGMILLGANKASRFDRVRFEGFGSTGSPIASILVQDADVRFVACDFGETRERDLLLMVRAKGMVKGCSFSGGKDQVVLAFAAVDVVDSRFYEAGDDAISIKGGSASISASDIAGAMGTGLKLDEHADVVVNSTVMSSGKNTVSVAEGSTLRMKDGSLGSEHGVSVDVDALHARHGASKVELTHVDVSGSAVPFKIGKGEQVLVDGKVMPPTNGTTAQ